MNTSQPIISIIVPVYKVERYLKECLNSIKCQTYSDWECILVDDGSPDGSGKICDEYASIDSRFRVIHRKNGGVSAARNTALVEAKGKYISFVDSDDYIYPCYLETLLNMLEKSGADVAQVGMEMIFTTFKRKMNFVEKEVVMDRRQLVVELIKNSVVPSYLWNKMFRRDVISIPFPEGVNYEDICAMTEWSRNICRVVFSPEILYAYRQRKGSIVNDLSVENCRDYLYALKMRMRCMIELEPDAVDDETVERSVWNGLVNCAKQVARRVDMPEKRLSMIMEINRVAQSVPSPSRKILGIKKWRRAILLLHKPKIFIRMMRFAYIGCFSMRRRMSHLFD